MLIIGSTAIKYWYLDFPRIPKDLDIVDYNGEKLELSYDKIEYLINPILSKYQVNHRYLKPNLLLTLKASHLCWDINWEKHMWDIQFLLKKGNKINLELFWELYHYWNGIHSKNSRSDLKMTKNEFFNNAINYNEVEHDELHKILNPIPIYSKVLKDGFEVELDENKFNNLSYEDKLNFVREEVMVMSFERFKNLDYKRVYNKMLKKFIISHAPLFSLLFIIENYTILQKCDINFIKILENGRKNKLESIK